MIGRHVRRPGSSTNLVAVKETQSIRPVWLTGFGGVAPPTGGCGVDVDPTEENIYNFIFFGIEDKTQNTVENPT